MRTNTAQFNRVTPKSKPDAKREVPRCPSSWWTEPSLQANRASFDATAASRLQSMRIRGVVYQYIWLET